ncbi:MAG: hypothetical protein ACREBG_12660 [Pyrinomonadaceae bacterium]
MDRLNYGTASGSDRMLVLNLFGVRLRSEAATALASVALNYH